MPRALIIKRISSRFCRALVALAVLPVAVASPADVSPEALEPAERPRLSNRVYRSESRPADLLRSPYTRLHGWNRHMVASAGDRFLPEPGGTSLWLAAGSDSYLGAGLATRIYDPGTHLSFSLEGSWESGETWWSNEDYEQFRIAPSVSWSNRKTTVWLSYEHSETIFKRDQPVPRPRPTLAESAHPDAIAAARGKERLDDRWTLNALHTGVQHRVNRFLSLGLSFSFIDSSGRSSFEPFTAED